MSSPEGIAVVPQPTPGGGYNIVILDRIEPDVEPPYCVHGRVTCFGDCGEWLWLGDQSFDLVSKGKVIGLCVECAQKVLPDGIEPIGNIEDSPKGEAH